MSSYEGPFSHSFRMLRVMGLWNVESGNPETLKLYAFYQCLSMVYFFLISLSPCIDFVLNLGDIRKWSFNLCFTITVTTTFLRMCLILWNLDCINDLRSDLNRDLSTESDENRRILTEARNEVATLLKIITTLAYGLFFIWILIPLGGLEVHQLPLQIWLPFDSTVYPNYPIIYVLHIIIGAYLANVVIALNNSITGFLIRISAEFDILKNNIQVFCRQFDGPVPMDYRQASAQLRDIIGFHQKVNGFFERFQKSFQTALGIQLLGSSFLLMSIGLDIVVMSSTLNMRICLQIVNLVTSTSEFSFYCLYGTRIINTSEELSNAVFGAEWYAIKPVLRRNFAFILQRCQKSPAIAAGKMFRINLSLLLAVLKNTYNMVAVMWQLAPED